MLQAEKIVPSTSQQVMTITSITIKYSVHFKYILLGKSFPCQIEKKPDLNIRIATVKRGVLKRLNACESYK